MKYMFLLYAMGLLIPNLYGQSIVSGIISHTDNTPIPYATVVLLNSEDSSIVAHCISNNEGAYSITCDRKGKYNLEVRCLGYMQQSKSIELSSDTSFMKLDFILITKNIELPNVEIQGKAIGIQHKNDTIRYNTKVFTDGSEIMLDDILRKLPGIDVDEQGNIQAHGEQVKKVLVNGKDFFSENTQLATKNIPADIVDNVDVLTNYSEFSLFEGFKSYEETVLNVGVNKDKFGKITGNFSAGAGYDKKYTFKGNLMQIRPKIMTSVLAALNNTGDEIFSFEDYFRLQGGFQSLINTSSNSVTLSGNELALLIPDKNIYEKTAGLSAINIAYQPNTKFKLNSYVLFSENIAQSEDISKLNYMIPNDSDYISHQYFQSKNKTDLLSGYLKINYQFSKSLEAYYRGNTGFTNAKKDNDILNEFDLRSIRSLENRLSKTPSTKQNFGIMKLFGPHLLVADLLIDYRSNDYCLNMESDSLLLPLSISPYNTKYYISQEEFSSQLRSKIDLAFLYKINKSYFLKIGTHADFNNQKFVSNIYQNNPFEEKRLLQIDSLQNNYVVNMHDYNMDLILTKNKGWLKFKLGAIAHLYELGNDLILSEQLNTKTIFNIAPYVDLSLSIKKNHKINLTYLEETSMNSAKDFASGIILENYQSYYYLSRLQDIYAVIRRISFLYNFSNLFSHTSLSLNGDYNREKNNPTFNFNQTGILTEYQNFSSKKRESFSAKLTFEQGLGNIPWRLILNTSYNHWTYFNQSLGIENKIMINRLNSKISIQSRYKKRFNMEAKAGLEYNNNMSLLQSEKTIQFIQNYSVLFKMKFNERWYLETSFGYLMNDISGSNIEFYYLNALLRYGIIKNKLELEIHGNNLLNLKEQAWMSLTSNGVYVAENYFRTIPGNILLKIFYKL